MMSRAGIEQAKGILMERHKIKEDEAFTILTHASQQTNTKLRDVADELVQTGAVPVPVDTQQPATIQILVEATPSPAGPLPRPAPC